MPDNLPPTPPNKPRGLVMIMLALFAALFIVILIYKGPTPLPMTWSVLMERIAKNQIAKVKLAADAAEVTAVADPVTHQQAVYRVNYIGARLENAQNQMLMDAISDANKAGDKGDKLHPAVQIEVEGDSTPGVLREMLPTLFLFVLAIGMFYFFIIRRMGQGGGVLSFGKSRAQLIIKGKTGKTFKDVAGIDEAKDEVEELVVFLKNFKKFQKLGGRIPRGVLLVGPPGTGKTLLAKAIAGEADVPFYSISGSDFVEMFVGVGASRVRDLFNQAKDNAPCIIFIDEIDAVGRRRGTGMSSGGHDEREQTLNAILVEMDGFSSTDKVIVIAATNRVDVLDPALLRPGRFDRHIHVSLPDIAGREQILSVHAQKVKMGPDVDLSVIARGTPGFSGADLESLINESARSTPPATTRSR